VRARDVRDTGTFPVTKQLLGGARPVHHFHASNPALPMALLFGCLDSSLKGIGRMKQLLFGMRG
jgi:hypothetical protein